MKEIQNLPTTLVLDSAIIEQAEHSFGENFSFQQVNLSVHCSLYSKDFFDANGVDFIDWLIKSSDFNVIENVWGHMVWLIHGKSRQYVSVSSLQRTIKRTLNNFSTWFLQPLQQCIPSILVFLIEQKGKMTDIDRKK